MAGGRSTVGKSVLRKVVVDVREFMSPLPAVLHQQGLEIMPVTLEALPLPPQFCRLLFGAQRVCLPPGACIM